MSVADGQSLRRRAAYFGWLTATLVVLGVGLLIVGIVLARTEDSGPQLRQALVPLNVQSWNPGGWVIAAVALLVATTFVGSGRAADGGGDAGARPGPARASTAVAGCSSCPPDDAVAPRAGAGAC